MPIRIDKVAARQVLLDALEAAKSKAMPPVEWSSHARAIFDLDEKTWTPAFVTAILAKAVNEEVDALSLKANADPSNPYAYSARSLCHEVIVPAAVEFGFSIRNKGREPLNNSPFGAPARVEDIERRAKKPENFQYFLAVVTRVNELSSSEAKQALAAFLREALAVAASERAVSVKAAGLSVAGVRVAIGDFLRLDAEDRPRRLQAFGAACLDLLYFEVRSIKLNDPSRSFPGDVHVPLGDSVKLAMEVRGKAVSVSDLATFASACEYAGVSRAVMFVDALNQSQLDARAIAKDAGAHNTHLEVFDSADKLFSSALLWSDRPLQEAVEHFSTMFLTRLREIEVSTQTLQEWSRAVAVAQGH